MKNLITKSILSAFVLLTLTQCQSASGPLSSNQLDVLNNPQINSGEVVAKAGNVEVREGFLKELAKAMPNIKDKLDNPMSKKKLVESILEQELMYQEGVKRGLINKSEVSMKVLINQRSVIASALMQEELDKSMEAEYEKRKDADFTKVEISQIVIDFQNAEDKKSKKPVTPEAKKAALKTAQDVAKQLKAGASFEELAKKHSSDKRTADRGGQAGNIAKNDKRFEKLGLKAVTEKAFAMKKGEVSAPIETEASYYIIKVTSDPTITSLEDAKRVLSFDLQGKVKDSILDDLRKKNPIEFVGSLANVASAPEPAAAPMQITGAPGQAPMPITVKPAGGEQTQTIKLKPSSKPKN